MSHEEFQQQCSSIPDLELAKMASDALSVLCKTGGRAFVMSVPPKMSDADIVFSELIRRFEAIVYQDQKSIPSQFVFLSKPNYLSKDGSIKEGIKIDGNFYAPKHDI